MKSERRHELESNELAEWFRQLPQLWKENCKKVIYVAVVIIVAGGAYYFKVYRAKAEALQKRIDITKLVEDFWNLKMAAIEARKKGRDESSRFLILADSVNTSLRDVKDDGVAALGLIKCGEALRAELYYRPDTPERQVVLHQMSRARQCYEQAFSKAAGQATLMALAKYGLALCEEEIGNIDAAERIYHEIISGPEFAGTVVVAYAQQRIDTMADYKETIVFAKAPPKPQVAEPVEPAITEQVSPAQSSNSVGEQPAGTPFSKKVGKWEPSAIIETNSPVQ